MVRVPIQFRAGLKVRTRKRIGWPVTVNYDAAWSYLHAHRHPEAHTCLKYYSGQRCVVVRFIRRLECPAEIWYTVWKQTQFQVPLRSSPRDERTLGFIDLDFKPFDKESVLW